MMYSPEIYVEEVFQRAIGMHEIDGDVALAIKFTQMVVLKAIMDRLGHEICMGIRFGLFGNNAGDSSSISGFASEISDLISAIEELRDTIDRIKT